MKTVGNPETQELITLHETCPRSFEDNPGYHPEQLCPLNKYWQSHPDAPWNVPAIERDPSWWRAEYPEAWANVADDDPSAPWNAPEPDRNPANYLDDDGEPLLWETPTLVPLVKLPKPDLQDGEIADPKLVWFDDRVKRDWTIRQITEDEIVASLPPHFKTTTGIRLATGEQDQTAFSRMLAFINLEQMPDDAMLVIKDAAGDKHGVSVAQFKSLMSEYGLHCYTLHANG